MHLLLFLTRPYRAKLHNAVAILSFLVWLGILLDLHTLEELSHVEILRVFHREIAHDVAPLEAGKGWLTFRLVSEQEPPISVFTMLQVLLEHSVFFYGHLFVANWAHVMVVAMIDVCFIRVV